MHVIDSHTAGEPTRVVLSGFPALGEGPLSERAARLAREFDRYRSAVCNEPRGSDPLVGALLCPPHDPSCRLGVIFFNNVGCLGMCGHGTIGLVASLAHLGELAPGIVRIDTPVGPVEAHLSEAGEVTIANVPSHRTVRDLALDLPGGGSARGDVAWGGNWFFLAGETTPTVPVELGQIEALLDLSRRIRSAANAAGQPVDHVELFGPPTVPGAHSRNYVLCPGGAYDRSPCGTGTSAKLACLAADGVLAEGEEWVQESVIGSTFRARFEWLDRATGRIRPYITGRAHVTAEAKLHLDPTDPFCWGIRHG
ncbi:MAG: proline racemase family protein [Verrucomicrobia bacterium]|nr:proline racemase family protein [Verrucomicrobiota bacterium]